MVADARPRMLLRLGILVGLVLGAAAAPAASEVPETVVVTYQVKADAEAALFRVISEHWRVARHMNLIFPSPHIVLQGGDKGKRYIVEVLTWRDQSIPDNAPQGDHAAMAGDVPIGRASEWPPWYRHLAGEYPDALSIEVAEPRIMDSSDNDPWDREPLRGHWPIPGSAWSGARVR